jgi:TRAP transporter TAXI family solute receptor
VIPRSFSIGCCIVALFLAGPAPAKDTTASIVIRAGKSDNPTHALAVQFAEAVAVAVNGAYTLDVQESQGSIQNVIDSAKAQSNYLFTAGPNVVAEARRGDKPFTRDPRYGRIRSLFPIPAQTVHWVVRQDSGVTTLLQLAGRSFISGAKGGVAERVTSEALQALGVDREVQIMDIDAAAAPSALTAQQVGGFAISGAYPLPALVELARKTPIRLLTLPPPQLAKVLAADDSLAAEIVPKGTYAGIDEDVRTLALPAGVYTTTRMSDATAYAVTKAFWSQHEALQKRNPPWQAVTADALAILGARLHAGALRYYRQAGIAVPKTVR